MTTPRLSILIPNFNNGIQSSKDGKTDLITDLLQSLWDTLEGDPTPLEIIAFDDGSTDDSLETLRAWSQKTWRGGEPFLTLMEAEHCGVLSITANKLVRASKGEIMARLDGDIVIHTKNWAQVLCKAFDTGPKDLGVIGPKQLAPDGTIHSMGDFILHPGGYHHVCGGLPSELISRACEVDHVMGCFYCCRRSLYDDLGGYDENYMRGQTVDFGMRSRLAGYRCWAIPTITFTHRHTEREDRATTADSDTGIDTSRQVFFDKWGFDRLAPDLDVVRERYGGTPLCWNAEVFGVEPGVDTVPASAIPANFDNSEWVRFKNDTKFRDWVLFKVTSVEQLLKEGYISNSKPVVVADCGSGIVVQVLSQKGIKVVGIDREIAHLKLAQELATHQAAQSPNASAPPAYLQQTDLRRLPMEDASASLVCVFDRMEAHDNPVSLIAEARRVAGDDGAVLAISKRPPISHCMPMHPYRPMLPHQMAGMIKATTGWRTLMEVKPANPGSQIIVLATNRAMPEDPGQLAGEPALQPLGKGQEQITPMTMQPAKTV